MMFSYLKSLLKKYTYQAPCFDLPVVWEDEVIPAIEEIVDEAQDTPSQLDVIERMYCKDGVWDISLQLVRDLTDYGLTTNLDAIAYTKLNKTYINVNENNLEDLIKRCDGCINAVTRSDNFTSKYIRASYESRTMTLAEFLIDNGDYVYSIRKALERINERVKYFISVIERESDRQMREYYQIQSIPLAREFAHLSEKLIELGV